MKSFRKSLFMVVAFTLVASLTLCFSGGNGLLRATDVFSGEVVDSEGNLLVPYDIAYPEKFADAQYDDSTILLKFSSAQNATLSRNLKNIGVVSLEPLITIESGVWRTAKIAADKNITDVVLKARELNEVQLVDYNYKYKSDEASSAESITSNSEVWQNPKLLSQWYLHQTGVDEGWKYLKEKGLPAGGSENIVVAVIDTGVDYNHEDLKNNMWTDAAGHYGYNFVAHNYDPMDDNGHGTHVAGIIASENNKIGAVGIAYNCRIMALKAGMASGYFNQSAIAEAVMYAYNNGADVINMSFGGSACSIAVQDALQTAYSTSVLVASAGNDGNPNEFTCMDHNVTPNYPAALPYVVGVMSVDAFNHESSFTNWDAKGFNGVEYEVYAPGEKIISALPNNRYASWNGTSMAAPVVSGMVALLRSYYTDRDMYPTKFIMGQICATGETTPSCIKDHECSPLHCKPAIANLYSALSKKPKPDIGLKDYYLLDTVGIDADAANNIEGVNNGDGIIDSGETIDLAPVLTNRWGMSKDTTVLVDALQNDIPNPYVTLITRQVNFAGVGTYSTKDYLTRQTDASGATFIVGATNCLQLKISKDCPNDYIITLNITMNYKNALDPDDVSVYNSKAKINVIVRSGYVLPSIIKQDMTLTKENYYILENSVYIPAGVTVTVEPGTQIQFWTADPKNIYADTAITYLNVEGKFLVKGTEQDPVKLFPSELFGQYRVQIYESGSGRVELEYANVTNGYFSNSNGSGLSYANHCTFNQNFKDVIWYRYLSSGVVNTDHYNYGSVYNINKCENSVFYKLGSKDSYYDRNARMRGVYENCLFFDSAINNTNSDASFYDCTFLGNNNIGGDGGTVSSITLGKLENIELYRAAKNPLTGTTYIAAYYYAQNKQEVAKLFGGTVAIYETEEEKQFAQDLIYGISNYRPSVVIEIPGEIYVSSIVLEQNEVSIDSTSSYQISDIALTPATAKVEDLIYESQNTAVATVSASGLVSGVAIGNTDIKVYSKDKAVYTILKVNVLQKVELKSLKLTLKNSQIAVGKAQDIGIIYTPANTTQLALNFSSSDTSVATVDNRGKITAHSVGSAVITAVGANNITAQTTVTVVVPATSVKFEENFFVTNLTADDATRFMPTVSPANATNKTLTWQSSNNAVCYVSPEGKLVKLQQGNATLKATIQNTDISAQLNVCITDAAIEQTNIIKMDYDSGNGNNCYYALMQNGSLWCWGKSLMTPVKIGDGIKDFAIKPYSYPYDNYNLYVLLNSGEFKTLSYNINTATSSFSDSGINITNVNKIYGRESYYAIKTDGSVWAWGENEYGQLGNGNKIDSSQPMQVGALSNIVDVAGYYFNSAFLDKDGNVYGCGFGFGTVPILIHSGAISLTTSYDSFTVNTADKAFVYCSSNSKQEYSTFGKSYAISNDGLYYIDKNGDVFGKGGNYSGMLGIGTFEPCSEFAKMLKVKNVSQLFVFGSTTFIQTADGKFYGVGYNENYDLANLSTEKINIPTQIFMGLKEVTPFAYEGNNLESGSLTKQNLIIDFSGAIVPSVQYGYIKLLDSNNNLIALTKNYDLDKLYILPLAGFKKGETYTLQIPVGAITSKYGTALTEYSLTFTVGDIVIEGTPDVIVDDSGNSYVPPIKTPSTSVTDSALIAKRFFWTDELINTKFTEFISDGLYSNFTGNVILNDFNDTNVEHWLRIAGAGSSSYATTGAGGNYWGTVNKELINKQIIDFDDYQSLIDVNEGAYLTKAPENTFPIVTNITVLNSKNEVSHTVGNEKITVRISFNRDMDTTLPLQVKFGSTLPFGDYMISGSYVNARAWEGEYMLNTTIENGYQYFNISSGRAASDHYLKLFEHSGRYCFMLDTTIAQSMLLQGEALESGISLSWTQDDFGKDTFVGYNVYRSNDKNGNYTKLNSSILTGEECAFYDKTVEPGKYYWYTFTVVLSDMTESEPAGKIQIQTLDTMLADIYHTPQTVAYTNSNLIITATITDNVGISGAWVYYKTTGDTSYSCTAMTNANSRYMGIIDASKLSVSGLQYYIVAFDGVNYTYNGSADAPHIVIVKQEISKSAYGDVDGNGIINTLDALMALQAIQDDKLLTADQFMRADLNGDKILQAAEVLRILQYISGAITSIL